MLAVGGGSVIDGLNSFLQQQITKENLGYFKNGIRTEGKGLPFASVLTFLQQVLK